MTRLPADSPFKPFVADNAVLDDPQAMRERMDDQGFVFLKGVGPKDAIRAARQAVVDILNDAGWIKPGTDPMDAVANPDVEPCAEGDREYMQVYRNVIYAPAFDDLPEHPALLAVARTLLGDEVYCHRRRIGRITFPNNPASTTGCHQDFHYIGGTDQTYTLWMPLGDCPMELGPLAVLGGSHRAGFIEHQVGVGTKYAAAGLTDDQLPAGDEVAWYCSDYELGDAVLFHSHTVHKATPNTTGDRFRISTDNRYQPAEHERGAGSDLRHHNL